ncbi:MAG: hypothetical protein AB4426_25005 [Xenococcaceae cyanobacterium]
MSIRKLSQLKMLVKPVKGMSGIGKKAGGKNLALSPKAKESDRLPISATIEIRDIH